MSRDPKPTRSVRELLRAIEDGEYVIPHFQRGYEWTPSMVSDLLVSIIQDYFSGLLLFWELNQEVIKEEKWDSLWGANESDNPSFAILDGQQRLASLYYAIYGPDTKFPNRDSYYMFFIDMKNYLDGLYGEAIFYRYSSKYVDSDEIKERKTHWIDKGILPLRIFRDEKFTNDEFTNQWAWEYAEKLANGNGMEARIVYNQILRTRTALLDYEFVTHTLGKERELFDICSIFARLNQKGMKLSVFDLMNAFLYPKGISLRKLWEDLSDADIQQVDSNLNEYLLKLMSLHKQDYCSSKYIYYLIPGYKTKKKDDAGKTIEVTLIENKTEFLDLWDKAYIYAERAVERIMNVGKNDFGAIKYDFIPNTTVIPVMGAILLEFEEKYKREISEEEFYSMIYRWYWSAVISGDYSGSSDSVISEDYRDLKNWFIRREISGIRRIGGVDKEFIASLDLRNCNKGSSLYNAILCLLALGKAEDFYTLRSLDSGTYKNERIHDHHIFPAQAKGIPHTNAKEFANTKDSILNRTLLLDETNEKIKTKRPSQYLKEMLSKLGHENKRLKIIMRKHFINEECIKALELDDYGGFIEKREKIIKEKLISLLGV